MDYLEEAGQWKVTVYRKILYVLLFGGILATLLSFYLHMWKCVPSTIMVKAGVDQELNINIPASGLLYRDAVEASGQARNNLEDKSISIDFSNPITVKANQIDTYRLQVKLFGIIPLKDVNVEVIQDIRLRPAGIPIGIYVKTQGVLVVGIGEFEGEDGQLFHPAKYILKAGDYILEMNDEEITGKRQLMEKISHLEGQEVVLKVRRGDAVFEVMVKPEMNQNGEYKMGIWIRDNAQGVGTMTYIDESGRFGALGHGINDVDTSTLMMLGSGTLYHTEIIGITRGSNGSPGELPDILANAEYDYLPIGLKQEIEKGPAQIICSIGEGTDIYDVEITDINLDNDNVNRGIVLEITDEKLLSATGGIVQGMSGSPIIQDGKIVGAVTHVLVQDSTKGYGIFIENMLEH